MKLFTLSILLALSSSLLADSFKVNFAPLPTTRVTKDIEDFLPMSRYLESKIPIKINYVYEKDYQGILDGFKDGSIDMAYFGPLPYLSLKKEYDSIEPIVTFKQDDGSVKYRCVLAKFRDDEFKKEAPIKVALTQSLSTCGYYMSSILLRENFNIDLSKQNYKYTMSHTNALTSVLKGEFLVAGAKESIAKKFESLGMEIIAKSELLPGFSLVVNTKTLDKEQIKKIKETLLELEDREAKDSMGVLSNGVAEASTRDYDGLSIDIEMPQKDVEK